MTAALFTTESGFNLPAIMRRAHAIRVTWRASRDAGEPGWKPATPEMTREDMGFALKRAWRAAKAERQAIADAAYWTRLTATETPDERETRLAALADRCNRESLTNAYRTTGWTSFQAAA